MVLSNVTKFHKIQIKTIRLREQNVSTDSMPRPMSWRERGHNYGCRSAGRGLLKVASWREIVVALSINFYHTEYAAFQFYKYFERIQVFFYCCSII